MRNKSDESSEDESKEKTELDLVFVVDNTGSMGPWIRSAQDNVQRIIREIVREESSDVRFALVSYRDHPPQDRTFVTQTHDFTSNVSDMQLWVDEMKANGGGDGPEAVAAAMYDALHLNYRPNSTKIAVVIADAPPHGLGCPGDGFPNGCPLGHDPLEIARSLAGKGVTLYSVICGNFEGQAFFQGIAEMTGGQYVPISSAHLLASVIVGGAQEEISLEKLMQDAQKTVQAEENAALDDDELATRLQQAFRGRACKQMKYQGSSMPDFESSAACYSSACKLEDVRAAPGSSHLSLGGYGSGMDAPRKSMRRMIGATLSVESGGEADDLTFQSKSSAVSYAQCKRMVTKSKMRSVLPPFKKNED